MRREVDEADEDRPAEPSPSRIVVTDGADQQPEQEDDEQDARDRPDEPELAERLRVDVVGVRDVVVGLGRQGQARTLDHP